MANQEQLEILKGGVGNWNRWREENHSEIVDLSNASLQMLNLSEANLTGADLNETYLCEANLSFADFRKANLIGADLTGANLYGGNLSGSFIEHSDFYKANLEGADLSGTTVSECFFIGVKFIDVKLKNSSFLKVTFGGTYFKNVNLSEIGSLGSSKHIGPSSMCSSTLYKSKDLPEIFFKGLWVI
jgi:uncharacterized protein YjbI with pentapeptide repeats